MTGWREKFFIVSTINLTIGELYATFENKIRAAQSLSCFGDLAEGVGLIHVREILPKRRRGK